LAPGSAALMTSLKIESWAKVETRTDSRREIHFVKKVSKSIILRFFNNNRKDNILCGRTFTVENSKSNEVITLVNDKYSNGIVSKGKVLRL